MFARSSRWFAFFRLPRGARITVAARRQQQRHPNDEPPGRRRYTLVPPATMSANGETGGQLPGERFTSGAAVTSKASTSLFATLEGRVQVFFCHLPEDWRQPFTNELLRILRQRRRGGYLPLPPARVPLSRERLGKYGEALRPLEIPAVYDLLRRQVEEGLRVLELPEEALSQARRCSDLAWQAARLGQLVAELDQSRRKTDAWQALWQALWTLPGARAPFQ